MKLGTTMDFSVPSRSASRAFLICCTALVASVADELPCLRLPIAPRIDGSKSDSSWQGVEPSGMFVLVSDGKPAAENTEVRVGYDKTHLYLIATCREYDVTAIQAAEPVPGQGSEGEDRVTFVLTTDAHFRFVASAGGALHDERDGNAAWSCGIRHARKVFKHAWGVELAIPLNVLNLKPSPDTGFNLVVTRHRIQAAEVSSLRKGAEPVQLVFRRPPPWPGEPVADVRPRSGIRYSSADIRNARANARRFGWAQATANALVRQAERALAAPAEDVLAHLPPAEATFAYGFAGCPKCSSRWPRFGSGLCSFERPGKVRCKKCGELFPEDDPSSPYHDPGPGVDIGGDRFYFKGVWHAWVVAEYKRMLGSLTKAYALTGSERYAKRAALLFDALATLAPSTVGPRDNMRPHQKVAGRFHYYTQQWTENLRSYLLDYDLIYHSPHMAEQSRTNATAGSIRANVEKNLFLDTWDVEMNTRNGRLPSLHNHTSATVRAMLGVGLVCGKPDLIRWGIEAAYKFIENTSDPEGQYYETSGAGYNECGRRCNASFADMLRNYDPGNYEDPGGFPQTSDYPHKLRLYDHPRLKRHLDAALYEMDCAGHIPRYGDSGADTSVVSDSIGQWERYRFHWAFALYRGVASERERRHYFAKMQAATAGRFESRLGVDGLFWYQPLPDAPTFDPGITFNPRESSLWGQRATAILRQGTGRKRLALLMLGGTIFPHGNDDTLHISFYSHGQLRNHEIAYDLYGRPIHYGWGTRSIAHTTVTVDERGGPPLYRGGPNANVAGFAHTSSAAFVAMQTGPACWQSQPDIRRYDRACVLVSLPGDDGDGYVVDLFDVEGGKQHDYSYHGQTTRDGSGLKISGATPVPVDNVWTLVGLSGQANASYDSPGRSWGERCLPGNRLRKLDIPNEEVGYFNWWPPPGNGYGFLYDVKSCPIRRACSADWLTDPTNQLHQRLTLFPEDQTTLLTARGPDLTGQRVIPYVIARRKAEEEGLRSSFLSLIEGYAKQRRIGDVREAPKLDGLRGLLVSSADGITDGVWLATQGSFALIRRTNGKTTLLAVGRLASQVEHDGIGLRLVRAELAGKITDVNYPGHSFQTDLAVTNPEALAGRRLFVASSDYTCNSGYRIEAASATGEFAFGLVGFHLASADVSKVLDKGVIRSSIPMPLVWSSGKPRTTTLLDGKLALSGSGARRGTILEFVRANQYRLKRGATLKKGDQFAIMDVKAGDRVTVPMVAELRHRGDGMWELTTTGDVWIGLRGEACEYQGANSRWHRAIRENEGFRIPVTRLADGRACLRVPRPAPAKANKPPNRNSVPGKR